ncbi:hypothetical protein MKX01_039597 [Papaver californicum]|nr:hypothetical protein MKX01_039597 [Papaver californicum]
MNIYVTTASNATENSWACYCPEDNPNVPPGYNTCLGDLYSINWMEHSEKYNMMTETLDKQYSVYHNATEGSEKKTKAWQRYQNALKQRSYFVFGTKEMATNVMKAVRHAGQSLVDDLSCYKTMVETYEKNCGPFPRYGLKHMRSLANMCNAGVKPENLAKASDYVCSTLRKRPLQHVY